MLKEVQTEQTKEAYTTSRQLVVNVNKQRQPTLLALNKLFSWS